MGELVFVSALGAGAAAIALWLDCRFDARRPESSQRRFVHAVLAFALLQIAVGVFGRFADATAGAGQRMSATFLLLLPSLVYVFLSAVWLVRVVMETERPAGR
jgi:hypothetical protein